VSKNGGYNAAAADNKRWRQFSNKCRRLEALVSATVQLCEGLGRRLPAQTHPGNTLLV